MTKKLKQKNNFLWTEEGYSNREYCYYCKANQSKSNKVNINGYGCDNCRNYNNALQASKVDEPKNYRNTD
jgi:hypothetical protein